MSLLGLPPSAHPWMNITRATSQGGLNPTSHTTTTWVKPSPTWVWWKQLPSPAVLITTRVTSHGKAPHTDNATKDFVFLQSSVCQGEVILCFLNRNVASLPISIPSLCLGREAGVDERALMTSGDITRPNSNGKGEHVPAPFSRGSPPGGRCESPILPTWTICDVPSRGHLEHGAIASKLFFFCKLCLSCSFLLPFCRYLWYTTLKSRGCISLKLYLPSITFLMTWSFLKNYIFSVLIMNKKIKTKTRAAMQKSSLG